MAHSNVDFRITNAVPPQLEVNTFVINGANGVVSTTTRESVNSLMVDNARATVGKGEVIRKNGDTIVAVAS